MLLSKVWIIVGALVFMAGVFSFGYMKGSAGCEVAHAEAVAEVQSEAREAFEEINNETVFNGDDAAALRWLSDRARKQRNP